MEGNLFDLIGKEIEIKDVEKILILTKKEVLQIELGE